MNISTTNRFPKPRHCYKKKACKCTRWFSKVHICVKTPNLHFRKGQNFLSQGEFSKWRVQINPVQSLWSPCLELHCMTAMAASWEDSSGLKCTIFSHSYAAHASPKLSNRELHACILCSMLQWHSTPGQEKYNKIPYWNSQITSQKVRGEHFCLGLY